MATPSHARAVKSLNKSPGRRRFVFKSFSERVDDIDINVYRSLEKVKAEPSEGSSFFRDCLIEWRELNTAEDFISLYEEIMPYTQTLPLVLLHKESLISKLLSRLHIKARLSLEPILRLIVALSRDLLEEFVPLLPRIVDSLVSLLESGGDREPDIIEQIFTSWSYIMMYLQKYLVRNPSEMLKVTSKLRYYPKEYVQQFMAEAMSFVLRNAPDEQLEGGIRRIIDDVMKKPSLCRESGVEVLLYNIMKGYSSRFHSKAERVLQVLTSEAIYTIGDKSDQDSMTILKIVKSVFKKLCEKMESKELNLVWNCLYKEVNECINTRNIRHLRHILSVLVSAIKIQKGQKVSDYKPMLELVLLLVQTYIKPHGVIESQEDIYLVDKILKLMLAILKGLCNSNDSMISECAFRWAPVFKSLSIIKSGRSSLLSFIRKLLQEDLCLLHFSSNVISAIDGLMEISEEEGIHLLQSFCEKMQLVDKCNSDFVDGTSKKAPLVRICSRLQETIYCWKGKINDIAHADALCQIDERMLALLWGAVSCYSHMSIVDANPSLMVELVDAVDHLVTVKGYMGDTSKKAWQSIIGAAISSYNILCCKSNHGVNETGRFLRLAERYKSSSQVLLAVAGYLEFKYGSSLEYTGSRIYRPELEERTADAVETFADNLHHSNKDIRIATLKILCHYKISSVDQPADEKRKIEVSPCVAADCTENNALLLLLSIETTPISISTSRSIQLLVSKIQMDLSAGRIPNVYLPLVLNGLFGILNNRFSSLWNPVLECIAVLVSVHFLQVWDSFIDYLERCQSIFHTSCNLHGSINGALFDQPAGLLDGFNLFVHHASDSTPLVTILTLLLQALQKISSIIEPRSRQFIPLFLKFLGYNTLALSSVGLYDSHACKGKEWKAVLKEWLNLLKLMKNAKSLYCNEFLKEVLHNRLLEENDPEIQMRVLDCLFIWKDDYILPYIEHLRNLISSKNLREELTTWSLSRESEMIEGCHRAYLVPIVIRLLMPKVRKLKGLASRKKASICHRKAILSFIAGLDVVELPLFFALLIKPLQIVKKTDGPANMFWTLPRGSIDEFQAAALLEYFTLDNIANLSMKKKYGFLHVIEDIVRVFDELHIKPFLDLLVGCVVRLLESCTSSLNANLNELPSDQHSSFTCSNSLEEESVPTNKIQISGTLNQLKDMRSLCLKIISLVLNKYEDNEFSLDLWNKFFSAVKPLIDKLKREAASSEKPSSLLSCFLAMSANNNLVELLCRNESLVPDIFSIISVNSASEGVVFCVLKFVENLLSLDNQFYEDNCAQRVLLSNIKVLMDSMSCLFGSDNSIKRKLIRSPGETVIKIFKFLPKYIREAELAKQFVDILLLFMDKKTQNSDVWVEALQVIQNIVPLLGHGSTTKILSAVSPLYISAELDMRLRICDLLDSLVSSDASVLSVAKLLRQLNATSTLGWLDHDAILNAYSIINTDFFRNVQVEHALLILSHCVHDMSSEETTFMCSAHSSLLSFVDFSALILCQEGNSEEQLSVMKKTDSDWTMPCIKRITKKFLLKHMADAMDESLSVRKGWLKLLHQMVLKLPEVSNLKSLMVLCKEDGEVNFFDNITDSVIRKRVKALSWFRNVISMNKFSEFISEKVFMRLFFNMLFDEKDGSAEHVKNACLETIASVAGQMGWKSYYALLMRCFQGASSSPDKQKLFIRLICFILDKFHFPDLPYHKEPKESFDGVSDIGMTGTDVNKEIQTCLYKIVLPKIQKLLDSDSEKVNVNISLAALKLLKLLPGDVMDLYLPTIVHRISNFLKSHLESIRDEARSALATCLKELGLEYLQFIVKVLQSTLKRGYELHVLGYTLNFILVKCLSSAGVGKIDYCVDDLLSVIENDILGDVAEQKEVEKIASKMKETRMKKSFESLKLVAQYVTFKAYALKLLAPVTAHLQKHITSNVKGKLENMLHHIATGIESNPSVDQTDLFIFIYGIIEDGLKDEIGRRENKLSKLEVKDSRTTKRISTGHVVANGLLCSHLITVFGLRIFHKRMKSMKQGVKDESTLSLLDPFVKLLCDGLCSKYEDILSTSLGCLTILVKLPLPSLQLHAERIKAALLDIAQGSVNSTSPLMQSCLTLLTVLLRNTKISLSLDQLNLLIHLPTFLDLEKNPSLVALSLLKGIVSRKLVVPEIYDLVTRVAELMVTSQMESIRKKCSKILLQFLLDYRLSEKRLLQHLDFLISNLRHVYEHSTGRESVLEMIHAIIVKFPRSVLDEQSQTLFVHLVACLANDNDSIVRSMSGAAIKKLVSSVSPNSLKSILEYALSWYLGDKQQLWAAGAQVLGLLIEVIEKGFHIKSSKPSPTEKGFHKHMNCILPLTNSILSVTNRILHSAIDAVTNRQEGFSAESIIPLWKEAYYSLVMLEKMINQFCDFCFLKDLEDIWEAICEMLLHPHSWIRNKSVCLIALYFAHVTDVNRENHGSSLRSYFIMSPSRLFLIATSLFCQLKMPLIDDAESSVMTQNIIFSICGVHSLMRQNACIDPPSFWSTLEQQEKDRFLKAFDLLDSRKGRCIFMSSSITSSMYEDNNQLNVDNAQHVLVSLLLRKMGKIALQMDAIQMEIVFNSFGSIMAQISQDECLCYAHVILLPLHKVCEGFAGKVVTDNVKKLAEDTCQKLENILGTQNFVQVYNLIRNNLKAKRNKRRQEEKLMAVINPMRNAKRKLRIASKHRANKKRKIMTIKMGRWMR
ncbi:hypothetical protein Fmac_013816 [Flemingia macrophylla]|uniref:Small subunit processome component 20 homolog n=1 Tax=Flemingia macrophylla TaxID=520843 RepID=A0ABD1M9Y7_9FABA